MSTYSATEAAELCQVSVRTVQRKLPLLEQAGAYRDSAGQWHITVAALRQAGLTPGRPAAPDKAADNPVRQPDAGDTTPRHPLAARVAQLEADLNHERQMRAAAEKLAVAQETRADDLRAALRALEAAVTRTPPAAASQPAPATQAHAETTHRADTSHHTAPPTYPPRRRTWSQWRADRRAAKQAGRAPALNP
jgi:hypothetical protein